MKVMHSPFVNSSLTPINISQPLTVLYRIGLYVIRCGSVILQSTRTIIIVKLHSRNLQAKFFDSCYARIRLEIEIEIGLEFNQSEERKPISTSMKFTLIGQIPIQSRSSFLFRYGH